MWLKNNVTEAANWLQVAPRCQSEWRLKWLDTRDRLLLNNAMNEIDLTVSAEQAFSSRALSISVIMPVYNGSEFILQSLPPVMAMLQRGEILEVIVIDDGSTDESADIARSLGAIVMSSGTRMGAGAART